MRTVDEVAEIAKKASEAVKAGRQDLAKSLLTGLANRQEAHVSVADRLEDTEIRDFTDVHMGSHSKDELVEFQKSADDLYILGAAMRLIKHVDEGSEFGTTTVNPAIVNTQMYRQMKRQFPKLIAQGNHVAKSAQSQPFNKAIYSTGAGVGDEWVPTQHSPTLTDAVRLAAKVAPLFRRIKMPSNPFTMPVRGTLTKIKILSEASTDAPSQITKSDPATANITLTTRKGGFAVALSEELQEDSIIAIIPWLRDEMVQAMAHGLDSAILNGDTTEPHQDSDVDISTHFDKAWAGLRKSAITANKINGSTLALSSFRNLRAQMDVYAAEPGDLVYFTSVAGAMRILGLEQFETKEKAGDVATNLKGYIRTIDGVPLIMTSDCRSNLNASGVYDGTTTTKTVVVAANTRAWVIGERRGVTLKTFKDPRLDQDQLIVTARWAFASLFPVATEGVCGTVYGISNSV